jgi:alpha-L-rhamnosidase
MRRFALWLGAVVALGTAVARQVGVNPSPAIWPASWIDVPGTEPQSYGIYHFRRAFDIPATAEHFVVHVSGDNRYQLFVNGQQVSAGPARGDLAHWRYEVVDVAPKLRAGKNVLAAVIWNDGRYRAVAQVTNQTGFLLAAEDPNNNVVNTGAEWKCISNRAYSPQPLPAEQQTGYYALASNEKVDAHLYPWGWQLPEFDDSSWLSAHVITPAAPREARDAPNRWMLVPSQIPLEEQRLERLQKIRSAEGAEPNDAFLQGQGPLTVPANTRATILCDQAYLTTAYPELVVNGGKDASITLRYAETLYIHKASRGVPIDKGNRDDVTGKTFYGAADTYIADGGSNRLYRPLFWRTYRYLQLEIQTASEPLTLEDCRSVFTGYPFSQKASFKVDPSADPEIQRILSTGWRTARLCAHETYMDCPYYEQLQYAGDARVQMMVSLYMTGDSRLMKNGIALVNSSRTAEGVTYSRAPSYLQQYIPPFSLWWIGMVHDYWMYVDDQPFVKEMLPGVRAVLSFYASHQKQNGSLAKMPWWNFVDWVKAWDRGEPPANTSGDSASALDLQLLLAYQWAADLENAFGSSALVAEYKAAATALRNTILASDWDASRGLFADQPEHRTYSQQVNTLAVLAGIVSPEQGRAIMEKTLSDPSLAQSSIYFRAYTNAVLRTVGLGDRYLQILGPWREMLSQGLTTWAEVSGTDSRSDCHAWGASPNFELLRTVAGIESEAPGFSRVHIAPNLGQLATVRASMPHPQGEVQVELKSSGGELSATIHLPSNISGDFDWRGHHVVLKPGTNNFKVGSIKGAGARRQSANEHRSPLGGALESATVLRVLLRSKTK